MSLESCLEHVIEPRTRDFFEVTLIAEEMIGIARDEEADIICEEVAEYREEYNEPDIEIPLTRESRCCHEARRGRQWECECREESHEEERSVFIEQKKRQDVLKEKFHGIRSLLGLIFSDGILSCLHEELGVSPGLLRVLSEGDAWVPAPIDAKLSDEIILWKLEDDIDIVEGHPGLYLFRSHGDGPIEEMAARWPHTSREEWACYPPQRYHRDEDTDDAEDPFFEKWCHMGVYKDV